MREEYCLYDSAPDKESTRVHTAYRMWSINGKTTIFITIYKPHVLRNTLSRLAKLGGEGGGRENRRTACGCCQHRLQGGKMPNYRCESVTCTTRRLLAMRGKRESETGCYSRTMLRGVDYARGGTAVVYTKSGAAFNSSRTPGQQITPTADGSTGNLQFADFQVFKNLETPARLCL